MERCESNFKTWYLFGIRKKKKLKIVKFRTFFVLSTRGQYNTFIRRTVHVQPFGARCVDSQRLKYIVVTVARFLVHINQTVDEFFCRLQRLLVFLDFSYILFHSADIVFLVFLIFRNSVSHNILSALDGILQFHDLFEF